jgi:hypothetical protein
MRSEELRVMNEALICMMGVGYLLFCLFLYLTVLMDATNIAMSSLQSVIMLP